MTKMEIQWSIHIKKNKKGTGVLLAWDVKGSSAFNYGSFL